MALAQMNEMTQLRLKILDDHDRFAVMGRCAAPATGIKLSTILAPRP